MSEEERAKGRKYAELARAASPEFRAQRNAAGRARAKVEYHEWQTNFRVGHCSICHNSIASFEVNHPCLHWLLVPVGFTKRHFLDVAQEYSLFQIQLFLRRVANEEAFAKNINDLADEGTGKLVEVTIRWNEYEWGISCSNGDFQGHESASPDSRLPHYHFQMRRKKQAFIRYNDFHIPLHRSDIQTLEAVRSEPRFIRPIFAGGEGMSEIFNDETIEAAIGSSTPTVDESEATFSISTMMMAEEGKTMSGDDLHALIQEAKKRGVPGASLAGKLKGVRVQTLVSPGDGVVEQAPRSGGRGKKK